MSLSRPSAAYRATFAGGCATRNQTLPINAAVDVHRVPGTHRSGSRPGLDHDGLTCGEPAQAAARVIASARSASSAIASPNEVR
jgi:hypothetical protein